MINRYQDPKQSLVTLTVLYSEAMIAPREGRDTNWIIMLKGYLSRVYCNIVPDIIFVFYEGLK